MSRKTSVKILFLLVFWVFAGVFPAMAQNDTDELKTVSNLFSTFAQSLKPSDLGAGSCVQNSSRFYELLLDAGIDTKKARLVLIVREPNRGMPQPMYPQTSFVRGEKPDFWIWHAIVVFDGTVFDVNYTRTNDLFSVYFKNMWGKDPNRDSFWVFSIQYKDLPQFAGSDYPGAPPRMLRYKAISPSEFTKNPLHLTVHR